MIESEVVEFIVNAGLVVLVGLLIPATYRVFVGPTPADRLQAIDMITTLLIGIIVLLTLVQGAPELVDLGMALAAFSFVATLSIARYLCEGRMF
jgi:multicomponent Na+:H+ antiporter subunit F